MRLPWGFPRLGYIMSPSISICYCEYSHLIHFFMLSSSSKISSIAFHMTSCGGELYTFLKSINNAMNLLSFFPTPFDYYYFIAILLSNLWTWISVPAPGTNHICPYPIYFILVSLSVIIGSNFCLISASTTRTIIGYIVKSLMFLMSIFS